MARAALDELADKNNSLDKSLSEQLAKAAAVGAELDKARKATQDAERRLQMEKKLRVDALQGLTTLR